MNQKFMSPEEILEVTINSGVTRTNIPLGKQFALGVRAGVFIALAGAGSTVASATLSLDSSQGGMAKLISSLIFPTGLMMVLLAGSQLFTGNSLLLTSVLDRKIKLSDMLLNWLVVYLGNFAGSILVAFMVYTGGQFDLMDGAVGLATVNAAIKKVTLPFGQAFVLGVLCNFLVCTAIWIAAGARQTLGKIWGAFFPIMLFVVSGYEHSVANMYYIPAAMFQAASPTIKEITGESVKLLSVNAVPQIILRSFLPVTLGNIVGGAIFVGALSYFIYRKDKIFS